MERESDVDMLRLAGWREISWLRHGFSMRSGGCTTVYGDTGLNLGWTKEDDPANVEENRRRFVRSVHGVLTGKDGVRLVTVRQVHGDGLRVVREEDGVLAGRLEGADGKAILEGDGLMTEVPGVLLGIQTADCVPVLVVDRKRRAVAAFHAGWRGTVASITEKGIMRMRKEFGSQPEDLMAAVGPSIGACCYEVGPEVKTAFADRFDYADGLFPAGGMSLDLWEANRRQLLGAGVAAERISVVGECTACAGLPGKRRYWSHRAERGFTGRMLSAVGIVAE